MINLFIQILDNPLEEFHEIQRVTERVKESIAQLQSDAHEADVSITFRSRHDVKFKIKTTDQQLKSKILDSLDPLFL
ncbi:MAG: hypothetical protein JST43_07645 [Bacteroidetes bacterium]|nr:hypothetical protein [Bacteroidota bacterium]MBS1540921.1 hypothetical protein [Bacteroidota bacterium]